MAQQVTNFARFYTAIRAISPVGDRDEVKRILVNQYTDGRTDSLKEMTRKEYDRCCADLERKTGRKEKIRKERSATLNLMQRMGVDTSDWERVNRLCRDPRIIDKDFYHISPEEHKDLRRKLRGIERKGGLRPVSSPDRATTNTSPEISTRKQMMTIPISPVGQA